METKFVTINETQVPVVFDDGVNYIPIRPMCQALGLDPKHHILSLKSDPILGDAYCYTNTHDTSGREQKMGALPEKYIYGWLFSIQERGQMSEETKLLLRKYKRLCYDVLFDYFHGISAKRKRKLLKQNENEARIKELKAELSQTELAKEIRQLEADNKGIRQDLKNYDTEEVRQLTLFDEDEPE